MLHSVRDEYTYLHKGRSVGKSAALMQSVPASLFDSTMFISAATDDMYLHPYQYELIKRLLYGCSERRVTRSYNCYSPTSVYNNIRGATYDTMYIDEVSVDKYTWPATTVGFSIVPNIDKLPKNAIPNSNSKKEWLSRRIENQLKRGWLYNAN